jgi:predicted DNA-binding mobile mystery protein A
MNNQFRDLQLQQIDHQLTSWRAAQLSARPRSGWVRAIRESLGMTATAFARRLGIIHAGVSKLETAEASDAITLASLRKLAEALDCELQYALIPRTSLKQHVQDQAEIVARERLRPVIHSMALEDQAVAGSLNKLQLDQAAVKELIEGSHRELW